MIIKNLIKTCKLILLFLIFNYCGTVFSQNLFFDQTDSAIFNRIKKDIYILASDSFLGREAGTQGEIMARDYIAEQYKKIGIQPAFNDGSYLQTFTFKDSPKYGDSNYLKINKKVFIPEQDFYPLAYSASSVIKGELVNVGYGIIVPEKNYNDYKNKNDLIGKIFVIEISVPKEYSSDSLFLKYIKLQRKIDTALAKGASGIIFVNSNSTTSNPSKSLGMRVFPATIPVIFAEQKVYKYIMDGPKNTIDLKVDIVRKNFTGYNIAAYIDNKAPTTIVIGGHYDHLGWGEENSIYTSDTPMVHNGADDNASGTCAVIEMARYFMNSAKKKNNYLFINFSAEEKGLVGSSYFMKSGAWDITKINFMINIDMVGRYDTSKVGLDLIGTGTSPLWDTLISITPHNGLKIKKTKSGFDGSDQMSFYMKDIPVLFFFTGIHADYHKPSDDADKLNLNREVEIIRFAEKIIEKTDSIGKVPFSKTTDVSNKRSSFSVTLGVVPDHSFDGKGMRIEGVLDGKPAIKAGLKAGDIVIKIDENEVSEIMSYMKALSFYKKGDKVMVTIKRDNEILIKELQF